MNIAALCLYLLGCLMLTLLFEPEEDSPKYMYPVFVFGWPFMTIYLLIQEQFSSDDE